MFVIKRDGSNENFNINKIFDAIKKAYKAANVEYDNNIEDDIISCFYMPNIDEYSIEDVQDKVENILMEYNKKVAKLFILYREEHKQARDIKERIDYMNMFKNSKGNAATLSETDGNANVSIKNVATLEGEVYKSKNRLIQRQIMKEKLHEMYPEVASQYEEDINSHIIYVHDEASSPTPKNYCEAVTLYPLMKNGTGPMDGVTPFAPNDINSFFGQVTNLTFMLSAQCKGAVAFGDLFVILPYYIRKEYGDDWVNKLNEVVTKNSKNERTLKDIIRKGMKTFIYGVNQPAGNRAFSSPFTNVSYYDKYFYESLFGEFFYPDGTKSTWKEVDVCQRIFMELHRELRLIKPLTFPVSTIALVHNGKDCEDKDYKQLCADEWAKGGSFFAYISPSATSLSSCCRVLNEITDNTFSSTIGMTGTMTGSVSVITLNLNRIIQDWIKDGGDKNNYESLKTYLHPILERVYKYQKAYKDVIYDFEDSKMITASNTGYIYMKKLYSTIGVIGYCEAAQFLGLEISNNEKYKKFLTELFSFINDENKKHSEYKGKRPCIFNQEAIPGENLAVKLYNWDKNDKYVVPKDQNLYSSYFFKQWDKNISILDKLKLHGDYVAKALGGGLD